MELVVAVRILVEILAAAMVAKVALEQAPMLVVAVVLVAIPVVVGMVLRMLVIVDLMEMAAAVAVAAVVLDKLVAAVE